MVVTGISRFRIAEFDLRPENYLTARGETVSDEDTLGDDGVRRDALFYNLKEISREILELSPGTTDPLVKLIDRVDDPTYLTNVCAAYLNLSLSQKQELLEITDVESRMDTLLSHMRKERERSSLQREIRDKMAERLNKAQREALLREQMRTIRTELGEEGSEETADELAVKLREAELPEEPLKIAEEELKRLRALPSSSAEYHVIRTYLEWLVALPWNKRSLTTIDIVRARRILDEDHDGLDAVKKGFSSFSPWPSSKMTFMARSSASRPAGRGQNLSDSPLPDRSDANSFEPAWEACGTRPKSGAIAAPMLEPCPAGLSRASKCVGTRNPHAQYWTRSTSFAPTFMETHPPQCSKFLHRAKQILHRPLLGRRF